ncbi:hypothetical protein BLOT_008299 [Blomia tropicalis]|nr:hypothetical protein BLOT_008299 [Blomia tropicalis]
MGSFVVFHFTISRKYIHFCTSNEKQQTRIQVEAKMGKPIQWNTICICTHQRLTLPPDQLTLDGFLAPPNNLLNSKNFIRIY